MRQITFRGKGKNDKKWYQGFYAELDDTRFCFSEDYEHAAAEGRDPRHHYIIIDQMSDWGLPNRHYKVDPDTVCEYTGMRDSNSKPIFEGDIILLTNTYSGLNKEEWYEVAFKKGDGCFVMLQGELWTYMNSWSGYCKLEVKGNRFDNPELLDLIPHFTPEGFTEKLSSQVPTQKQEGEE